MSYTYILVHVLYADPVETLKILQINSEKNHISELPQDTITKDYQLFTEDRIYKLGALFLFFCMFSFP